MFIISSQYKNGGGTVNVAHLINVISGLNTQNESIVFVSDIVKKYELGNVSTPINIQLSRFSLVSLIKLIVCIKLYPSPDRRLVICNGRGGCFYGLFVGFLFSRVVFWPRGFQSAMASDRIIGTVSRIYKNKITYVGVGSAERDEILKVVGPLSDVVLIRNPIESNRLNKCNYFKEISIYWAGRDSHEKRLQDLVSFVKKYDGSEPVVIFVEGYTGTCEQISSRCNMRLNLEFYKPGVRRGGIYLSFSIREGFPTTVAEAISMKMIPVLTRIAPHLEAVGYCLTFQVGDIDRCIQVVRRVRLLLEGNRHGRLQRFIKIKEYEFSIEVYKNKIFNLIYKTADANKRVE